MSSEPGAGQGDCIEQDFIEAVRWYQLAVDQEYTDAQYRLGRMYLLGRGLPIDYEKSAELFAGALEEIYDLMEWEEEHRSLYDRE